MNQECAAGMEVVCLPRGVVHPPVPKRWQQSRGELLPFLLSKLG